MEASQNPVPHWPILHSVNIYVRHSKRLGVTIFDSLSSSVSVQGAFPWPIFQSFDWHKPATLIYNIPKTVSFSPLCFLAQNHSPTFFELGVKHFNSFLVPTSAYFEVRCGFIVSWVSGWVLYSMFPRFVTGSVCSSSTSVLSLAVVQIMLAIRVLALCEHRCINLNANYPYQPPLPTTDNESRVSCFPSQKQHS